MSLTNSKNNYLIGLFIRRKDKSIQRTEISKADFDENLGFHIQPNYSRPGDIVRRLKFAVKA